MPTNNTETLQRLDGPMLTRAAAIEQDSILDADERRVRLSFSSEEPYLRSSWFDDPWMETLGHDEKEVDMARLATGGAPLLYNHSSREQASHIGVVERAWLEGGRGYAEVRLSKRAGVDDIWRDIQDGILKNVSVGYKIMERRLTKEHKGQPNEYRVTRWQPMEISMVPLPADATVGVGRSENFSIQPIGAVESPINKPKEVKTMPDAIELQQEVTRGEATAQDATVRAAVNKATEDERNRQIEIRGLVRKMNLDDKLADSLVTEGKTIEQARAAVIDALATKSDAVQINSHHKIEVGPTGKQRFIEDASAALLARAGHGIVDRSNQMRGYTLLELARRMLEMDGVNTGGMDKMAMAGRAFTQSTSDFAVLLENTMHKVLLSSYATQANTWTRFCKIGSVSDFRAHNRYRTGSFGTLDSLNELGEYKNKSIPDGEKASITAGTKGNIINLSRQVIINDDLGAFIGLASDFSAMAARTIESDVYALLALNSGLGPTMGDTYSLFYARGTGKTNIGTGAAISVESIDADRQLMASIKDISRNDFLDLRPSILLCSLSIGSKAREINGQEYNDESSKQQRRPNVVRGIFKDVVDTPRLTGTRRYMFADPAIAPVLEVAFLDGQREPFLEAQNGFTVDGVQWKVRHDYGVAAIDYRGAVTNAGA